VTQYDNTNSGVLFRNDRKQTEKHPDYTGNINVNGTEFWLSAWIAKSKAGVPLMRLKVNPKEEKAKAAKSEPEVEPFSDEIPF
jgi:hypothetical protein